MTKAKAFFIGFLPPFFVLVLLFVLPNFLSHPCVSCREGDYTGVVWLKNYVLFFFLPVFTVSFFVPAFVGLIGRFTTIKLEGHYGFYGSLASFITILLCVVFYILLN